MSTTTVTTIKPQRPSLIADMAARYNMEPKAFADTLRATVVPPKATNEEFAAFLMVAREYSLNPITKEIYAFPKQGGGIQPIVSVDGWANLINSHPQCDGFEFQDSLNDKGDLVSVTCCIYRKDRSRPTTATEYMIECRRDTSTWKQWPRRMLRHKALIQAARYAFGFADIVDPDEAERFTHAPRETRDITPRDEPPAPPPTGGQRPDVITTGRQDIVEVVTADGEVIPDAGADSDAFIKFMFAKFAAAKTADELNDLWETHVEPAKPALFPPDEEDLMGAYRKRERELS